MLGRHQTGSERLVSIQKAARQVVDSQQRHHTVRRQHIAAIVSADSPLRWSFWLNAMVVFSVWWTKMTARCLCSVQHRRSDQTIWCWDASSNTSCWTWSNWASRNTKACKSSKMRKSAPAWSHACCFAFCASNAHTAQFAQLTLCIPKTSNKVTKSDRPGPTPKCAIDIVYEICGEHIISPVLCTWFREEMKRNAGKKKRKKQTTKQSYSNK